MPDRPPPKPAAPAPQAPLAATHSRLLLPSGALAGCVRALMVRDTRGVALSEVQRENHFPATPLCSLNWTLHGQTHGLLPGHPPGPTAPRLPMPAPVMFFGPSTGPMVSHNPGPVRSLVLLLMPDALHALSGLSAADWVDRHAPLQAVLGPRWQALGDAVLAEPDEARWLPLIEDFVLPRWAAAQPAGAPTVRRYQDWTQALALRAATSGPGRSLRQIERRLRLWAGQPLRELQVLARGEQAFFEAKGASQAGQLSWAEVAADSGYADQSHLGRVVRRLTGFAPQALSQRILADERFWAYRIWM